MATSAKLILAALGSAALLGGCATGPYYDNYGDRYGYDSGYPYGYEYGYVAPSVGFGYTYSDHDRRDYYDRDRRDRDGRWRDNRDRDNWQGGDPARRNEPRVSREEQYLDDINKGIAPPDRPSQDIGQYSR